MKWTSEKALGELLKWKLFSCSCSPASLGKLPANLRPSRPISSHPFAFTPVAKISPVNHPFQKSRSWANQVYPKATSIISFPKNARCCTQGISGRFPLSVGHLSPSDPQRINFFLFFFFPSVSLPLSLLSGYFLKLYSALCFHKMVFFEGLFIKWFFFKVFSSFNFEYFSTLFNILWTLKKQEKNKW